MIRQTLLSTKIYLVFGTVQHCIYSKTICVSSTNVNVEERVIGHGYIVVAFMTGLATGSIHDDVKRECHFKQ